MQQAIDILDEMIKDTQSCIDYAKWEWEIHYKWKKEWLQEVKSRIQALWDGWIPVTERLPKPLINHIVWHHDWMTLWAYHDWVWYWDSLQHLYNVTHWMPLPLPPK